MIKLVPMQLLKKKKNKNKLLKGFCREGGTEVHCGVIVGALRVDPWIGAVNCFSRLAHG